MGSFTGSERRETSHVTHTMKRGMTALSGQHRLGTASQRAAGAGVRRREQAPSARGTKRRPTTAAREAERTDLTSHLQGIEETTEKKRVPSCTSSVNPFCLVNTLHKPITGDIHSS